MPLENPLVTVITVVRNGEKYIEQTIRSVISQTYPNVEFVIIDGGSTDGTVEIVKKYEGQVAAFVSEPDRGIYDAMNKGIARSTGSVIGIINADDWYESDAIDVAVRCLQESVADYCYGSVYLVDEQGKKIGITEPVPNARLASKFYDEMPFGHPSAFVRKSVYLEDGLFDITYRLSADYEFFLRIHRNGRRGMNMERVVANFRIGGASGKAATFREVRDIAIKHGKARAAAHLTCCLSLLKLWVSAVLPRGLLNLVRRSMNSRHRVLEGRSY